jgi:hypothetical protein
MQQRTSRRSHGGQRWLLLRRRLLSGLVVALLVWAYRLFCASEHTSSLQPHHDAGVAELPRVMKAEDYLRMSTHNTSLDRREGASDQQTPPDVITATALERRVDGVLRRRWSHTAGAAAAAQAVRIRVATVANRVDFTLCAAQAAAIASGVNVSVVGFGRPYSHVTRLQTYLDYAEKEGMADEDVMMLVDSDVLWTGMGLEDALAKFIAFSPPSQASLWPAAVRAWEDYGEHIGERFLRDLIGNTSAHQGATALLQLPPILFGAERYCNWMQMLRRMPRCDLAFSLVDYITELVRNGHSDTTAQLMVRRMAIHPLDAEDALGGVRRFLASRRALAGDSGASPAVHRTRSDPFYYTSNAFGDRNIVRFLNGGGVLMRVWALRVYAKVVHDFVETQAPYPALVEGNNGWFCDQSIHGPLYVRGRMFEAAHGLLTALPGAAQTGEAMEEPPYALPSGMTGLDRRSEFFFTAAGMLMRLDRNYVGTEYYQRYAGHRVFRLLWYLRRLRTWWIPGESVSAVRRGPTTTASGCALTSLLLRRPPCREDVVRGYKALRDDDADVTVAPLVHIPGNDKEEKYAKIFRYIPWRVAARWSCTANATLFRVLGSAEVEVWGPTQRHHLPFFQMCPNVSFLL